MTTIERICAHDVEFWYRSQSKNAVPSESEIEHVQQAIIQGCESGELNMQRQGDNGQDYEFDGWWKILRERN